MTIAQLTFAQHAGDAVLVNHFDGSNMNKALREDIVRKKEEEWGVGDWVEGG